MKPVIRASGLDDTLRCHGSRLVRARVAEQTSSVAAAGNWGHYDSATKLMTDFEAVHLDARGEPAPLEKPKLTPNFKPSWFDIWMADYFVRTVRETMDADMLLEVEVELAWEFDRFILSGHIDSLAISPDGRYAKAYDYKSGPIPVDPADENWQVMAYIVLLFLAYEKLEQVTFYIVQPRNDEDEGWPRVSEVTIQRDRLEDILATLETEVHNALDHEMQLTTGVKQCRHCVGAVQCPAIEKELEEMKHLMTAGELEAINASPDIERLMGIYLSLKTLDSAFAKADAEVRTRVEAAGGAFAFDGTRRAYFKPRNGPRKVEKTEEAYTRLSDVLGTNGAIECFECKPSKVETVLADALGLPKTSKIPGRASGQSRCKELLAGLVEQPTVQVLVVE